MSTHKRQTTAWILIAVFIPMLFLASLHRHIPVEPGTEDTCYACLHHIHHNAHLNTLAHHTGDCVLCHFLSLPFLATATLAIATPYYTFFTATTVPASTLSSFRHGVPTLRGPPSSLTPNPSPRGEGSNYIQGG